ncbi:hypothetical protein [Streptomyces atacamensis]|jgi:hypothetical protein|uniref:hypothetical protein n=1 Tax=Streptomyces atacamensis TaxID=531966 RepID=UPI00399C71C5
MVTGTGMILTGLIVTAMGLLALPGARTRRPSPPHLAREPLSEPCERPDHPGRSVPRDLP